MDFVPLSISENDYSNMVSWNTSLTAEELAIYFTGNNT